MKKAYKDAFGEVEYILNFLEEKKLNKIPIKFRDFLHNNKSKDYTPKFNLSKNVYNQEISEEARVLIAYIYRKYLNN